MLARKHQLELEEGVTQERISRLRKLYVGNPMALVEIAMYEEAGSLGVTTYAEVSEGFQMGRERRDA